MANASQSEPLRAHVTTTATCSAESVASSQAEVLDLLAAYPSPTALRRVRRHRLVAFLVRHGSRRAEALADAIRTALTAHPPCLKQRGTYPESRTRGWRGGDRLRQDTVAHGHPAAEGDEDREGGKVEVCDWQ